MRKIFVLLYLLITNSPLFAQIEAMGGEDGILQKIQVVVNAAEEKNMEVVRIEADLIRTSKETIRTLDPNFTYVIAAIGSARIQDIDLTIYKKSPSGTWILVDKDDDTENISLLTVKPSEYTEYKFVVKVYKFVSNYEIGHYGLLIMHD